MRTAVVDDEIRAKLHGLDRLVGLRGPDGEPLGHFLPDRVLAFLLTKWPPREADPAGGGMTRDEVLADLHAGRYLFSDEAIAIAQRIAELHDGR